MARFIPKTPRLTKPKLIPSGLSTFISDNIKPKRELPRYALALAKHFYYYGFDEIVTPLSFLRDGWGLNGRDSVYIIGALVDAGAICKVSQHDRHRHKAAVYRARRTWLKKIYTSTQIIYPDIDRSLSGKYKPTYSVNVSDAELRAALGDIDYYMDAAAAFECLMTIHPETRGNKWQRLCTIPQGNNLHCSWKQAAWGKTDGGRLYTYQHNWQGLPKEFRVDGVFCDTSTHIVEQDFTAQHTNILLIKNGITPSADTWQVLSDISGLSRDVLKQAINPMLSTQREYGYVDQCREKYGDQRPGLEIIQERLRAIDALISLGVKRHTMNAIDYMKQGAVIMQNIVKAAARQGLACMPLHDGVLCRGPESIRGTLTDIFTQESEAVLGTPLPSR